MIFEFLVCGDTITAKSGKELYTGNTNSYECRFQFSNDWDGFTKMCVFLFGGKTHIVSIDENGCIIPNEILNQCGNVTIGLYGTDCSGKRLSTNLITVKIGKGAYKRGITDPEIPSPDLWETLILKTVPIIGENGNWWIWSLKEQGYIDSGVIASYDDTEIQNTVAELNKTKVDKENGKGLSSNDFTDDYKNKLDSLENYNDTNLQETVEELDSTKADKSEIPKKVSELENDSNFVVNGTMPAYNRFGVVKTNHNFGIDRSADGTLYTIAATEEEIKNPNSNTGYKVITPNNLDIAVKSVGDTCYENKSNKVTELTESCTDEKYPSAKAVKDYVDSSVPEVDLSEYMKTSDYVTESGGFKAAGGTTEYGIAIGSNTSVDVGVVIGSGSSAGVSGIAIGVGTQANMGGVAIGEGASTSDGGAAIGSMSKAGNGFSGGNNAQVIQENGKYIDAIQLGTGTNSKEKTLQVYSHTLMNADGTIPDERIPTKEDKIIIADLSAEYEFTVNQIPNKYEIRCGELPYIPVNFPNDIPDDYISSVVFTSGGTVPTVSIPSNVYMQGTDCSDGVFTPVANKRYTIIFSYDGEILSGIVNGIPKAVST